jgi:hypothetical protein
MVVKAAKLGKLINRVKSEEIAILQATGMPTPINKKKLMANIKIVKASID